MKGKEIEFLDTLSTPNFDLIIDGNFATEVKLLEDNSKWTELSRKVLEIPSDYMVWIETDIEIRGQQRDMIVDVIGKAVAEHSETEFSLKHPSADLDFVKASKSGKTLPIVGMRHAEMINVPDLRRLFLSRITIASHQLESSGLVKIVAIDVNNPWVYGDLLDEIFCGSEQEHFTKETFEYRGSSRLKDGVLHDLSVFRVVDGILIFFNNALTAHYWKPRTQHAKELESLGTPHTCG